MEGEVQGFKILTWNINGLRSLDNFTEHLRKLDADILCFQETKVTRDMLTEQLAVIPGYTSYYAFSRGRGGYSGVATYCRTEATPVAAEEGVTGLLGLPDSSVGGLDLLNQEFSQEELRSLDNEGRCVLTKHRIKQDAQKDAYLVVFNVYCPRADPEREDRKRFKLQFYKALDIRAHSLRVQGNKVVILGDVNTSHRELDHCDPYEEFHDHPGRRFLNHLLYFTQPSKDKPVNLETEDWECERVEVESNQFLDSFRIFHPSRENAFTCWNTKMNCRSTNYGTRIDYIFISRSLETEISLCEIHPEVEGSDHCPVSARFNLNLDPSSKPPSSATKYYPEFQGRQLSIKDLFSTGSKRSRSPENNSKKSILNQGVPKKSKPSCSKITNFFAPKKVSADVAPCLIVENKFENLVSVAEPGDIETETLASQIYQIEAKNGETKAAWGNIFKPPPPNPLCLKHKEESLKRKVTKKGPNLGREFFVCRRGEGRSDDPEARCDFFKWAKVK